MWVLVWKGIVLRWLSIYYITETSDLTFLLISVLDVRDLGKSYIPKYRDQHSQYESVLERDSCRAMRPSRRVQIT